MNVIEYDLEFESPVLIGALSPGGTADRATVRDENGLPCVPARTVRGRVKDAIRGFLMENGAAVPAFGLCIGQQGVVPPPERRYCVEDPASAVCPLCRIFGAPGGLRRGYEFFGAYHTDVDANRIPRTLGTAGVAETTAGTAAVRYRIKRSDRYRRAERDHLFMEAAGEVLAPLRGSTRETPYHHRYPDEAKRLDRWLLLLGMRLVDRLGASRNRGAGRCSFEPHADWETSIMDLCTWWAAQCKDGTL